MNKKWNVIIITLFIVLIIWVIWLIITKYLLNLIKISSENHKYYKAYYAAYAGIELELWKLKHHGMWFKDSIPKTSSTVSKNITWVKYYFSSNIYSTWKYISSNPKSLIDSNINCSIIKNYISLWTWDAIILPLIYDENNWEWVFSWKNYEALSINPNDFEINYSWDIIVSFQSNDNKINKRCVSSSIDTKNLLELDIFPSISSSLDASKNPFLVIAANSPSKFCIDAWNSIVTPYSYIQSIWNFMDRAVQLNVIKHHKWANFVVYWIY